MYELGNLAMVAARHPGCALMICEGTVKLFTGEGLDRRSYSCEADDNGSIEKMILLLNFGEVKNGGEKIHINRSLGQGNQ